jgi:hypothetical protein
MKTLYQTLFFALGALAASGTAFAQVPSTNDTSDKYFNTGSGTNALFSVTPSTVGCGESGTCNTAAGYKALYANTVGFINTAVGVQALYENTSGDNNTAVGYNALYSNTIGEFETAIGVQALYSNTRSQDNTAIGYNALYNNTTGSDNTAVGFLSLVENKTGEADTALGVRALEGNVAGVGNTAVGYLTLPANNANDNTAIGNKALYVNKSGAGNTASGYTALFHNTAGRYNIAEGYKAGYNLTTGNYNIDVGNMGVAAEAGIIRIGTSGQQTQTFIAGIANNTSVSGPYVVINSTTGQLGVSTTSPPAAVKTAYVPKLLREMRRQAAEIRGLKQQQLRMEQQMAELKTLNEATRVALRKLQANDELMAQR